MKRLSFLMILILAAVPLVLFENSRVYAASSSAPAATTIPFQGLVCFSQVADSCPALPAQFSAPLGSRFTAYVGVQGAVFTTSPGTIGGTTIIVQETTSFDHVTAVINGTLVLDSTARTLTGHLTLTLTNSTSGQVIFSRTFTVLMIFGSNPIFKFVLLVPVTPVALGAIATVDSSTARVNFFLSRNPDMANVGVVNIVDVGVVFRDYGTAEGSQSYDPAADLNANGTVDIVDVGLVVAVYGAPVFF